MPSKKQQSHSDRRRKISAEYAGQWVAWNEDETTIVAHARTLPEAIAAAEEAGYPDALFERVRRLDEILVGRL